MPLTLEAPATSPAKPTTTPTKPQDLNSHICKQVLDRVGKIDFSMPAQGRSICDLKITARHIKDKDYRVNVWTQDGFGGGKVALSYYVSVNVAGTIVKSNPPLPRKVN